MLMRTPGQPGRGVIEHGSIGLYVAPQIERQTPNKRREFLTTALGLVAGVAVPGMASAEISTEKEMDSLDKQLRDRGLIQRDQGEETFLGEFTKENQPQVAGLIKGYIDKIVARSNRSKLGVHMQRHENVMWLIKYFNDINRADPSTKTDPRVFYYPNKVGINSKFVADFLKESKAKKFKVKEQSIEDPYAGSETRELKVYLKDGERVEKLSKNKGALAFIDTGWGYVILPKDTSIIISGNKMLIAACRNPIHVLLSECP